MPQRQHRLSGSLARSHAFGWAPSRRLRWWHARMMWPCWPSRATLCTSTSRTTPLRAAPADVHLPCGLPGCGGAGCRRGCRRSAGQHFITAIVIPCVQRRVARSCCLLLHRDGGGTWVVLGHRVVRHARPPPRIDGRAMVVARVADVNGRRGVQWWRRRQDA
jgi:hypothetical protein